MSKSNLVSSRKNILKELKDSLIKIKDTHSYIKKLSNEKEEIIGIIFILLKKSIKLLNSICLFNILII